MTLLTIAGLGKRYGETPVLADISFDLAAGGRTAIVGPSGSGKSTLLRLIAGFEPPDTGRIIFDGAVMADGPRSVPAHRRGIGIVAQDGALFPHLSVAENIGFGIERGMPDRDATVRDLMDLVELDRAMLTRRPHELSGGQQQRVALARALARKPRLMLLDEPFSALDTALRDSMRKGVARVLATAGTTAILVTHDQAEALSFADRVAVLRAGRLVQIGTPRELYFQPRDRDLALFLGEAIILPAVLRDGEAHCALGTVAVQTARAGRGEILVRPEQIRIATGDSGPGVAARVTEREFSGASSVVTLVLEGADLPPIAVRTVGPQTPEPGSLVRLSVDGAVHAW